MTVQTLASLIGAHGVDVHDHLDREELVPVSSGLQFQGDVAVIPSLDLTEFIPGLPVGDPVPAAGVPVVRGESGGNTHLLLGAGAFWADGRGEAGELTLGTLTVPEGVTAWLAHPEHGYLGVGPGVFEVRRQREQRDVIAMVAD
jgi:hypothetical protein